MCMKVNGELLQGMLDTGAKVTLLKKEDIPTTWPMTAGPNIQGVGGLLTVN